MKQRISVEDLKQLTPSQQGKLRAWWKPQNGDWYMGYHSKFIPEYVNVYVNMLPLIETNIELKGEELPLLSIGQCIELLEVHDRCINITNAVFEFSNKFSWEVRLRHLDKLNYKTELIDTLFEAVKSIL